MYIHRDARLIYLAHPRTASVATAEALQSIGFEHDSAVSHHAPVPYGFFSARLESDARKKYDYDRDRYTVFTTIRNHYDTCLSWALNGPDANTISIGGLTPEILKRALDNGWVKRRSLWWPHGYNANRILRYETLQDDLDKLLADHGLHAFPGIPRRNVTALREGVHYERFYTPQAVEYVTKRFGGEVKRYGYQAEEINA